VHHIGFIIRKNDLVEELQEYTHPSNSWKLGSKNLNEKQKSVQN